MWTRPTRTRSWRSTAGSTELVAAVEEADLEEHRDQLLIAEDLDASTAVESTC